LSSVDPDTGSVVELFNPRSQQWGEHFQMRGATIIGLTPVGRATSRLMGMNESRRSALRKWLVEAGEFE
jgi:hypothetical protein